MKKLAVLLLLGMTYRIVMSLCGVDGVDTGFCNTFYQVFFQYPDANIFNFIYYLLGLLGALWEEYFGQFGLLGFRVLEAFTLTGAIFILCLTFKDCMSKRQLYMAIILSMVFPTIFVTFHYNTLSFLLVATATCFFKKALTSDNAYWLLLSGVAIGTSLFVRIVNGTLLALLAVPLAYYWCKGDRSLAVKKAGVMFVGVLSGIILMLGIMLCLGQQTYYMSALGEAFSTFQGSGATHSHGHLISRYFGSIINVVLQMAAIVALYYAYLYSKTLRKIWRGVTLVLLTSLFVILTYLSLPYLTAMALSILLMAYFLKQTSGVEPMKATVSFLLLASLLYPFGSDIGMQGVFHWCAGLLIFPAVWCAGQLPVAKSKGALIIAYFSILACAVGKTVFSVYGEDESRFSCTTQIQSDRLNVFTTAEKAARYEKTIKAINRHLGGKRLLFVTNQASELYYATRALPYEGHVQPVIYLGDRLVWRLDERLSHFKEYPLIVMLNQEHPSAETPEVQEITARWMTKQSYRLVYDDGNMKLYKPLKIIDEHE